MFDSFLHFKLLWVGVYSSTKVFQDQSGRVLVCILFRQLIVVHLYQEVVPLFLVDRNQGAGLQRSFNFLVGVRKHFKVKVGECLLRVFVGRLALLAIHCSLSRTVVGVQWNSKSIRCGGEGFLLRRRIIFVHKDGSEEFVECRRLLDILTE